LNNKDAEHGELIEAIDKEFNEFQNSILYELLQAIFPFRSTFIEKAVTNNKFVIKKLLAPLDFKKSDKVVLIYTAVKSEKFGFSDPTPIAQLESYKSFLAKKFLESDQQLVERSNKLCYASGEVEDDVAALNLSSRYSLNKMFVTETKNYASLFDKQLFSENYQVSLKNQEKLDLASEFLLKNYTTTIAGVNHVIIPQFMHNEEIDFEIGLDKLKTKSDLLFSLKTLDELTQNIEVVVEQAYWIDFIAIESDGNFFKTLDHIKDISKFHFQRVYKAFVDIDWEFKKLPQIVDWESVKYNYKKTWAFNLNTIYELIPVRRDKEKKNVALQLIKTILENRKIERKFLFDFFSELMLCHYYRRYGSYKNVKQYGKDYFGLAIRDSVFKYLAFFQVLKKLNLIDMEQESKSIPAEEVINDFDEKIDHFFRRMDFNEKQKAMFFLGRMLNAVTYLQKDKKRTVIDKINYNGMDRDDIVRLRVDLFEKAKQYGKPENILFNDSHFSQYFAFEKWDMNPKEAVFFILTGYSFGIVKKQDPNSKNN
ncbi:MAG TPA: TM1802 family CRISPR-associated protein, partial [Bacteroidales bacterium]|nr:TM1802 family CRISPR-associated protein [Bacteroidales bacterium]